MRYLTLLRGPHVARLLTGTLVGRLPAGMTALVIALALREAQAPYSRIGAVTAAYAVAAALGGPVLGRMVDRAGQPRVLVASAVAAGLGYALLAVAPGDAAAAFGGAALAGLAMPPLEPCLRALWPDIVDERQLDTAYALDSASQQLLYVVGPLAVAVTAAAASPTAALWIAAGLGLAGALVVATAAPARAWTAPPRDTAGGAGLLGPLRSTGLVLLLVGLAGAGWALGSQAVLYVAYAEAHHGGLPGGAGTLLAVAAFGGLVGALVYGAVPWRAGTATRTWALASLMAAGFLSLVLLPSPAVMTALSFLTGLGLAPLLAAAFVLIGELAPPGTTTEAFAWLVTVISTGNAAGAAVSGVLVDGSLRAAALCGAAGITVSALLLFGARRRLVPPARAVRLPEQRRAAEGASIAPLG
ncbi:MFS transporter [Streptacidiphilus griseoplanus]|uniref:MFS transporter n=1 Tax=Peterkaempfera griseoplana TaxID=66896 RepID=UPI0006E2D993|nr:MFS transporter [Peterkaempfera griseoplana]